VPDAVSGDLFVPTIRAPRTERVKLAARDRIGSGIACERIPMLAADFVEATTPGRFQP
jgi:hypothetical protein